MKPDKPFSDYDPFASVYNHHWGTHFIPLIVPILETQVLHQLPEHAAILDLCCGTGQLTRLLGEMGYRLTGIEGSSEMLRYARENAPGAVLLNEDARSFSFPSTFQAVISAFDSLNHILTAEELASVFDNVYASLSPGGIFLFDLNMEPAYKAYWNSDSNIIEEEMVCIIRETYEPSERIARFYTTIFTLEDYWTRTDFTLIQRCYTSFEIISGLERAGFTDIRPRAFDIRADLTDLTEETERGFFLSKKPLS